MRTLAVMPDSSLVASGGDFEGLRVVGVDDEEDGEVGLAATLRACGSSVWTTRRTQRWVPVRSYDGNCMHRKYDDRICVERMEGCHGSYHSSSHHRQSPSLR